MNRTFSDTRIVRRCSLDGLKVLVFLVAISAVKGGSQTPPLIPGVKEDHCSQILGTADSEILACQVWDGRPELFSSPRQLEIYRGGKRLQSIDTGAEIIEWHFWKDGKQMAVHFGLPGSYALYDIATGSVLERSSEKPVSSHLPDWAKSQSERSDEAVPQGLVYNQQRTQWIAKLLREIQRVHPGMKRKDLQSFLTTEGGISTRYQRTYISLECPYIKLDVRFRVTTKDVKFLDESPDDVIEAISTPYLGWAILD